MSGEPTDRIVAKEKQPEIPFRKELDARINNISELHMAGAPGPIAGLVQQGLLDVSKASFELRRLSGYLGQLVTKRDTDPSSRFLMSADAATAQAYLQGQFLVDNIPPTFREFFNQSVDSVTQKQIDAIGAVLPEFHSENAIDVGEAPEEFKRLSTLQTSLMLQPAEPQTVQSLIHSVQLQAIDSLLRAEVTRLVMTRGIEVPMPPNVIQTKGWHLLVVPEETLAAMHQPPSGSA